jgi:hypothetical protein
LQKAFLNKNKPKTFKAQQVKALAQPVQFPPRLGSGPARHDVAAQYGKKADSVFAQGRP